MHRLLKELPKEELSKLKKKIMPSFTQPMLAQLTDTYFSDPKWIFERKLDGERCLIFITHKKIFLKSRNDKILNVSYPELVEAFEKIEKVQMILDSEVVAFDGKVASFSKLAARFGIKSEAAARATGVKVYSYIFDIIYLDGYDLTHLPLIIRKKILKNIITFEDPLRYTTHKNEYGIKYRNEACKKGWEGLIAKKRDSIYVHKRSSNWLKFKCVHEQELVIGGYTSPQGSRVGFGALLLGYYKGNTLKYAGKVGTGFNDEILRNLKEKFDTIASDKNPFDQKIKEKNVNWVKPKLVAQIGFTQWTKDNKLRHPRFLGLRRDKKPKDVVKEE